MDDLQCISLVVPLRDEEHSLEALVGSIKRQTRRPDEVILVDGGSKDQTVALAHALTRSDSRFRVIEAGEATPGRGRNIGIAAAGYDWIALTDAGIELQPDWLAQLSFVIFREPATRIVYGNFEPVTKSFFEQCAALAYVPPQGPHGGGRMRGPFIASALIHRDTWKAVGGFPDLRAAEDLIFMERLQARGFKIGWAPNAMVRWQLQPTLGTTFRKFVLYSRHNVWAGRQGDWHYGVARQYLAALFFALLALLWNPLWVVMPLLWFSARVAKTIWQKREDHGILWFLNPLQFVMVAVILATIDLATFVGWVQALLQRPGSVDMVASAGSDEQ